MIPAIEITMCALFSVMVIFGKKDQLGADKGYGGNAVGIAEL